jgi:hypothetical protein
MKRTRSLLVGANSSIISHRSSSFLILPALPTLVLICLPLTKFKNMCYDFRTPEKNIFYINYIVRLMYDFRITTTYNTLRIAHLVPCGVSCPPRFKLSTWYGCMHFHRSITWFFRGYALGGKRCSYRHQGTRVDFGNLQSAQSFGVLTWWGSNTNSYRWVCVRVMDVRLCCTL